MSKMKKVIGVFLAATMTFAMGVSTFAATGITTAEQTILTEAKQKAVELGVDVNTSSQFKSKYAEAEAYLAKNDLTQEQANAMVASINEAATTAKTEMGAKGVTKLTDLSSDVFSALQSKVTSQIKKSAEAVGITISVEADGTVTAQNVTTGDTVSSTTSVIKQTGADMTATIVIAAMFLGAVAVCGFVASKKKLFAGVEA